MVVVTPDVPIHSYEASDDQVDEVVGNKFTHLQPNPPLLSIVSTDVPGVYGVHLDDREVLHLLCEHSLF